MKKCLVILVLFLNSVFASTMSEYKWEQGETLLTFLEKHTLPLSIYYNLDTEEQELATEIMSGVKYQVLKSDDGKIEQVLIPIGEELQLHIFDTKDGYKLTTTPIAFQEEDEVATIEITQSPYQDIINSTNNYLLAHEFIQAFKNSVNFKMLRSGDRLAIFYKKRTRLGHQFGAPKIEASMVEVRGRKNYVFRYNKDRFYDENGKEVEGFFLSRPVNFTRISSPFSYKRYHPVLKRYRAHLGIDYAAPPGTPIKAAGNGKVIFVGTKGGYGKTVIVRHQDGYKTLYAHMRGYKKGVYSGKYVKKGDVVGYVGSTGISTGPHLHFGLYKNDRAINPASVVKITKSVLSGDKKKEFLAYTNQFKEKIDTALADLTLPPKNKSFEYIVSLKSQNDVLVQQ
ncbi:MAG TPA: endopeptidase [Sulfurospirillum sp. UBA12182]|jgi:murein DD-endopeptidase MepM/ murein hydrolase activator NlpD|nr:MAG TPA: endopeptidase [Sulfurospirillum sp. UBA12182]